MTGKEYHELIQLVRVFQFASEKNKAAAERAGNASVKENLEAKSYAFKDCADELEKKLTILNS